jgi:hypothetical protein
MSDGDDVSAPSHAPVPSGRPRKPPLKERLSALFAEYGRIAVVTYFTLSILTIIGFSIAIGISAEPSSTTGMLGVIAAGWVAAKATLPIRILITLGLTPMVAFVLTRRGRKVADESPSPDDAPDAEPPAPGTGPGPGPG